MDFRNGLPKDSFFSKQNGLTLYRTTLRLLTERLGIVDCLCIVTLIALFCSLYLAVLEIHVWRHDSLVMIYGYGDKLVSEGRWLNYFLFSCLKRLNPQIAIFLGLSCFAYFSYVVAKRYTSDFRLQVIYVLVSLQLPAFYSIIGWPLTVLPSFVLLAFIAYTVDKVDYRLVFLISGILFFGSFNNFYNLVLLLYIREIGESNWKKLFYIFAWWVASYLLGFLITLVFVRVLCGNWGLVIADWRRPHKIQVFSDVIENIKIVWDSLRNNLRIVSTKFSVLLIFLCIGIGIVDCFIKKTSTKRMLLVVGAVLMVFFAGYAQSVPYGFFVVTRTAVGLYAAVFTLLLIVCCRYRNVGLVFVLLIGLFAGFKNIDSIRYYTGVTNTWRQSVISMNVPPAATNVVHVCSSSPEVAASERMIMNNLGLVNFHQEGFGVNWRQFSILNSIGYRHYDTDASACVRYANRPRNDTKIHTWLYEDKQLFIWYK